MKGYYKYFLLLIFVVLPPAIFAQLEHVINVNQNSLTHGSLLPDVLLPTIEDEVIQTNFNPARGANREGNWIYFSPNTKGNILYPRLQDARIKGLSLFLGKGKNKWLFGLGYGNATWNYSGLDYIEDLEKISSTSNILTKENSNSKYGFLRLKLTKIKQNGAWSLYSQWENSRYRSNSSNEAYQEEVNDFVTGAGTVYYTERNKNTRSVNKTDGIFLAGIEYSTFKNGRDGILRLNYYRNRYRNDLKSVSQRNDYYGDRTDSIDVVLGEFFHQDIQGISSRAKPHGVSIEFRGREKTNVLKIKNSEEFLAGRIGFGLAFDTREAAQDKYIITSSSYSGNIYGWDNEGYIFEVQKNLDFHNYSGDLELGYGVVRPFENDFIIGMGCTLKSYISLVNKGSLPYKGNVQDESKFDMEINFVVPIYVEKEFNNMLRLYARVYQENIYSLTINDTYLYLDDGIERGINEYQHWSFVNYVNFGIGARGRHKSGLGYQVSFYDLAVPSTWRFSLGYHF